MIRRIAIPLAALALLTTACGSRVRDWPDDALAMPTSEVTSTDEATTTVVTEDPVTSTTSKIPSGGTTATTKPSAASAAIPAP